MTTGEQAWQEFLAAFPETVHVLKYALKRPEGEEPTPLVPTSVATAVVDWALTKGYTSEGEAARAQKAIWMVEVNTPPEHTAQIHVLELLTLLLR